MTKPIKNEHILTIQCSKHIGKPGEVVIDTLPEETFGLQNIVLLQREYAETNTDFRQLIPYTALCDDQGRFLVYRRNKGVGEARLAGKTSIGFGGHIDLNDVVTVDGIISLQKTIQRSGDRELKEELDLVLSDLPECVGHIIGNANIVDKVHLGIFYVAFVGGPEGIESQEPELELVGWQMPEDIDQTQLEAWSVACVNEIVRQKKIFANWEQSQLVA
jgi:predicted NUDIX family phosphoesterase